MLVPPRIRSTSRRQFIATCIGLGCSGSLFADLSSSSRIPELRSKITTAVEKGLQYLRKSQKAEGYWSSPDFPGLSGLVIQAFVGALNGKHGESAVVQKGLKFIRESAKPDGGIYNRGMGNYNTSIALATLVLAGETSDQRIIEAARKYLIGAQNKDSAQESGDGGFGYEAGKSGRMSRPDLDNTVFALEALAYYRETHKAIERPGQIDLNWKAAIDFVSRCQNLPGSNPEKWASSDPAEKGGFTYTPVGDDKGTHSYGSMTYAGLLSLVYAEVGKDDTRVKAAVEWLSRHYSVDQNPGQGEQGLYYYYFVMAKGLNAAGIETLTKHDGSRIQWREELATKLLSLQKPDGSWASENGRWMEKDPTLVSSYVIIALNALSKKL